MPLRHLLPLLLLALAASPNAHALYKWRDANGRVVYSDLPPPASVSPSAVLQAPSRQAPVKAGGGPGSTPNGEPQAGGAQSQSRQAVDVATEGKDAEAGPKTMADRELEFRKRRQERLEAESKANDAQARARQQNRACDDSRNNLRTLESGIRVSRMNAQGEVEVLDDRERESRIRAARRDIQDVCKSGSGS